MTSTFRLMSAEFRKIFKRPSVYIMALFIVITIFLSMYIFEPVEGESYTVEYGENLSSQDYYDIFYKQDLINSEIGINNSFDNTNSIHSYYLLNNDRDNNLKDYYNSIIENIENIRTTNDEGIREKYYNSLKTKLNNFYSAFKDFSTLTNYNHIKYSSTQNYYLTNYSKNIKAFIDKTNIYDSYEIIEYYDSNDIKTGLLSDLNSAINYISPTLYSLARDMKSSYDLFNQYYGGGSSYLVEIELHRKSMLENTNKFKSYFDLLVDNNFPIVLINTSIKNDITAVLEFSIEALNSFHHIGQTATLPEYTTLKEKLDSVNFANYFTTRLNVDNSPIDQVKLDNTQLELFTKIKLKVEDNRVKIKDEIISLKQDETIKNIQFKITEYYLLSKAYNEFINDSIIVSLGNKYPTNEFVQMYSEDSSLEEYNEYQYTERITENKYYINYNIYSNSFISNFSFNQNSQPNKTNVYDFMYFTMELCMVIIIVFAMLLITSLIAGESDSGTIKLLLVRPYKRSRIVTAKLLATIFFVVTFMIFSGVLSFTAGYFTYGYTTINVLAIFNATTPIVISPLLLMLINILSLLLEAIFYIFIALAIATVCKNYAGSIYVCLIFIIVSYVLNVLFGGALWYSFFPGMNLHLFKYFGNSFISVASSSVLQSVLITPIQSSMSFLYSGLLTLAYSLIAIAISYSVFNKRDF